MLLGEVVALTTPEALKPALLNVTGPLIRIFGDRFNWNVKVAILDTLALLLKKVRESDPFKTVMAGAVVLWCNPVNLRPESGGQVLILGRALSLWSRISGGVMTSCPGID